MCFSWKRHSSLIETNLCSCFLEEELLTFVLSERWRLLTSPCSLKIFSLVVPENAFDFSGDGLLLTYINQTSLAASFSCLQILQAAAWRVSPWFQKAGSCGCYFLNATFWIQFKVTWNQSPSYNLLNSGTVWLGLKSKSLQNHLKRVPNLESCAGAGFWAFHLQCWVAWFCFTATMSLCYKASVRYSFAAFKVNTNLGWYVVMVPIPDLFFSSTGGWWWRCWSPQVCTHC